MLQIAVEPHPLLELGAFVTRFPRPIGELTSPAWLTAVLSLSAEAPLTTSAEVKKAVRKLLRHGGYRPTGRGKPASEYLIRAASEGTLQPINLPVDACNAVSLHSGLPISVVDLGRSELPLAVAIAADDARYVFNPAGQEMRLKGLLCLHDANGPAANGVKDSQRTKTHPGTTSTLSLVWGAKALTGRTAETVAWYRRLYERLEVPTEAVELV